MKKFAVTDEKVKTNSHADMRTSHAQLLGKGCQHEEEDSKTKIFS